MQKIQTRRRRFAGAFKPAVLSSALGAVLVLTGCGGGGGGSFVPVVEAKCAAIAGPGDPVQDKLIALSGNLEAIPEAGVAAQMLVEAIVSSTDVVDALAATLQTIATTQDPAAIAEFGTAAGERVNCAVADAAEALETLNTGALAGTPAATVVEQALAQIEALQGMLGASSLPGGTPPDLETITGSLSGISAQLESAVALIPVDGPGAPELRLVLDALAASMANLASLLESTAQLDAAGTAAALMNYYAALSHQFSTLAQTDAGPLNAVTAQLAAQVESAADQAEAVLSGGLVMLLETVFDAVRTVLGGPVAGPAAFEEIITGLITATPVSGDFAQLIDSLAGGGSVPELSDLLAGVPVLGELAAEILGSSFDPANVLDDLLSGAPGMPTLGEVLAQLPDLGGLFPPSPAQIQGLVADLLALNGQDIPVISAILTQVGGEFAPANLDQVSDLLTDLLGGVL